MAMTYDAGTRDIVQEAFNLIRQDYSAPAVSTPAVDVDAVSDASLEWSKARLALKTAANEVFDAFGWGGTYSADAPSAWSAKMRNALVYTLARELAIPVAGRVEDMRNLSALAAEKLSAARARAINDALDGVSDAIPSEVVAMLCEYYSSSDAKRLPHSVSELTNRLTTLADTARREVLVAHDWNFATRTDAVVSCVEDHRGDAYRFTTPYPTGSLRLVSVSAPCGRMNEWIVENGNIRSVLPATAVRYIQDVTDMSDWSPLARSLPALRLKALVARTVTGSVSEAAAHEQIYLNAVSEARTQDARESNAPTDAWQEAIRLERPPVPPSPFSPFRRPF